MHLLSAHNLTKYYAGKTLFAGASFSISPGERVGVVGVNGSGKTTLLNLMAGLDVPDAGQITRHPHTRIACLPQNPVMDSRTPVLAYLFQGQAPTMQLLRAYKEAVLALAKDPAHPRRQKIHAAIIQRMDAENGWAAEARAKAILTRLGITQFDSPLGQLSGGERRRVALARALLDPADLLILDEPTNHIDPETIIWLETRLSSLKTALLMVTHDRYFLDRVVSRILEIDRGQIYAIQGNYSAYLEQKTRRETLRQKQTTDRRNVLRRELDWLHRAPMARGGKQKARIKRANALLNAEPAPAPTGLTINLTARRTGKQIIELKHVSKTFGGQPLIKNFSCTINKGARLGIIGPNGVGKTTLL
ncbi:MAG: ABC-F family ATP-binding cassette domain-containing protein, partial [Anaerolineae bacterium]